MYRPIAKLSVKGRWVKKCYKPFTARIANDLQQRKQLKAKNNKRKENNGTQDKKCNEILRKLRESLKIPRYVTDLMSIIEFYRILILESNKIIGDSNCFKS